MTQSSQAIAVDAAQATERNPLEKYTQYQPYFRFFMLPEGAANAMQIPGVESWRIIAETGGAASTAASIEEVEITSHGGMDKDTGTGVSSEFNLVIKQAFEATVLDEIYQAAEDLGIQQVRSIPFFLELTFRVRDPSSEDPLGWQPLRDYRWVWPLALTETEIDVTSQGSNYRIKAFYFGDQGRSRERGDSRQYITIKDVRTVKEFFDQLATVLTQPPTDTTEAEKNAYRKADEYEFKFLDDEEIAEQKLKPTHETEPDYINARSDNETDEAESEEEEAYEFSFTPGSSIEQIVIDVLLGTDYFQEKIAGNESSSQTRGPHANRSVSASKFKRYFRVISEVENLKYNTQTHDYDKRFTYHVIEYETSTAIASANDTEIAQTTLEDYVSKGRLRRVYNYIFTGLNNDVLNFDLKFNFNWYAALPWAAAYHQQAQLGDIPAREPEGGGSENRDAEIGQLTEEVGPDPGNLISSVTTMAVGDANRVSPNQESFRNRGRNFISVLFEQRLSPLSSDLLNIEIEIKGDPYWMEPLPMPNVVGKVPRLPDSAGINTPPGKTNRSVSFETYFLFTAYTGNPPNPDTGEYPPPSNSSILTGVYMVRKAVHTFKGGKFTQTLTATRDLRFNVKSLSTDANGQVKVG
ncbi:MAG: hypothetical protein ACRC16_15490 [Aeromonas salmonicida]